MVLNRFAQTPLQLVWLWLLLVTFSAFLYSQPAKKYWVYFIDKGPLTYTLKSAEQRLEQTKHFILQRALDRRAKTLPLSHLVDEFDLPIYQGYLDTIQITGGVLRQQSRWLNAASFLLTAEQIATVEQMSFVKKVSPVVVIRGKREVPVAAMKEFTFSKLLLPDYGNSRRQMETIGVPLLHQLGITGYGVLVGMLDTGFRWKTHEALRTRKVHAEFDFIQMDSITANQAGDPLMQDAHGTATMSVLGGYKSGELIGPAYDAEFVLAKTEYIASETRIEEDDWAAALEWMEGLGVDVVSSSLGYNIFDDGSGYYWANGDFDGRTSVTAKAAVRAARLGVVVCDAMGNEGNGDGIVGTMLTPADADSIIAVGAVNYAGQLASFSSTGPTNDGRIKPDLVAPGVNVYHATTGSSNSYGYSQGTSMSTPLTAGCAALLLSLRPELTPIQVRDILRNTAVPVDITRFPVIPNNFVGWGLVQATNAVLSLGVIFSNKPQISIVGADNFVSSFIISKNGIVPSRVVLYVRTSSQQFTVVPMWLDSAAIFPTSGKYKAIVPQQPLGTVVQFYIKAEDSAGNSYQSPPLSKGLYWQMRYGTDEIDFPVKHPHSFQLFQNYPNPFNVSTTIVFEIQNTYYVEVAILNLLGEAVRKLFQGVLPKNRYYLYWDGKDEQGLAASSGVYLCRLSTEYGFSATKMLLIR